MATHDDTPRSIGSGSVPFAVPVGPEAERFRQERAAWWQQRLEQRMRMGAGATRSRRGGAPRPPSWPPPSWPPSAA
jgi:hypothetical protein